MERVPILKIGRTLFVSIQIDLQDESVMRLHDDLSERKNNKKERQLDKIINKKS